MNPVITNSLMAIAFLFSSNLTILDGFIPRQIALYSFFESKSVQQKQRLDRYLENDHPSTLSLSEPEQWELKVEGFSPAYYDKVREAIAVNTLEQPTDQWAAATTSFEHPSGIYSIRFTSLLESDGECSYILKIGGNKVMDFQNPRIYGEDVEEYAPHEEEVNNVKLKRGSLVQVEFLPHSNGLVPEGDGFGYARARWKSNIEFIRQKKE